MLTALIGGVLFISVSYFLQLFFPDISRFQQPDAVLPEIALYVGGKLFQAVVLVCTTVAVLASGLASHAGVSRLLYVMGRDRALPSRVFGYIHPTWQTPALNVLLVGMLAPLGGGLRSGDGAGAHQLRRPGGLHLRQPGGDCPLLSQAGSQQDPEGSPAVPRPALCGAACIGVLWLNLEPASFELGLIWAALGAIYLLLRLTVFRVRLGRPEQDAS